MFLGQHLDDAVLRPVRVLVLVDEHVVVRCRELSGDLRRLREEALPREEQVVVVRGVRLALALPVLLDHADDLLLERQEVRRALRQDVRGAELAGPSAVRHDGSWR